MFRFIICTFFLLLVILVPSFANNLDAGDLDGDGIITIADLKILAKGLNTLAATYEGDVTGDNYVNETDLRFLARLLLTTALPEAEFFESDINRFIQEAINSTGNEPFIRIGDKKITTQEAVKAIESSRLELSVKTLKSRLNRRGPRPNVPGISPEFPDELNGFVGKLENTRSPRELVLDITKINNRRNRMLDGSLGSRSISSVFSTLQGKERSGFSPSETVDPGLYGQQNQNLSNLKVSPSLYGNGSSGKKQFVPRSKFNLQLNLSDIKDMSIKGRVKGGAKSLADLYTMTSPTAISASAPLLPRDVSQVSDDPLISQLMLDMSSSIPSFTKGDSNKDGVLSRSELFNWLFNEDSAQSILRGNAATMGLKQDGFIVTNYARLAHEVDPTLVANGNLTMEQGLVATKTSIQTTEDPVSSVGDNPFTTRMNKPPKYTSATDNSTSGTSSSRGITTPIKTTTVASNPPKDTMTAEEKKLNDLYKDALGREPDKAGMDFYKEKMAEGLSFEKVKESIYNSPEYITKKGAPPTEYSNEELAKAADKAFQDDLKNGNLDKWDWHDDYKAPVETTSTSTTTVKSEPVSVKTNTTTTTTPAVTTTK